MLHQSEKPQMTINSQKLLINLMNSSKILPIAPNKKSYHDLNRFRQEIDIASISPAHQPYQVHKKKASFYRGVFACLGFLFFCFMCFIYFKTAAWISSLYVAQFVIAKTALSAFCGTLSLSAFFLAFFITPEAEAVNYLLRQTKRRMTQVYIRKCAQEGISRFFFFWNTNEQAKLLNVAYHESMDKLHDMKENATNMLSCIKKAQLATEHKTTLFNQALMELRDNYNSMVNKFKSV